MKIYEIVHLYDVDGGFGDPVPKEEIIRVTTDKASAEAYVAKYNKPFVYDVPYAELECHHLEIREREVANVLDLEDDPFEGDFFNEESEYLIERHPEYADKEVIA